MSGETYKFRTGPLRQTLRFEITEGPRAGETIELPMPEPGEPPALIGRSRECAIWIDAQNISRRNTEILSGPDRRPLIRDMGSVNGTQVNGQPISQTQPVPLRQGDHVRVGLTELIFTGLITPPISGPGPSPIPSAASPTVTGNQTTSTSITGSLAAQSVVRPATLPGQYFVYLVMREGQRYQLDGEEISVGRGQANDIVIDSNSISRQHARLQKTSNGVYVQDLGSTNKTFVNNVQADSPVLLRDGDLVRFGEVEADFKLEPQRLTQMNRLLSRQPFPGFQSDPAVQITQPDLSSDELTFTDSSQTFVGLTSSDQTFAGGDVEQTFVGGRVNYSSPISANRRELEQSETALNLDIRIVGKSLRQSASVMPEAAAMVQSNVNKVTAPTEVARLEGVFLTEGSGRALDTLLINVRLGLKPGELVALVGPSGSGKTELLQLMAGLRAADRGLLSIMGRQLPTVETTTGQRPNLEADRELARWRLRRVGYLASQPEFQAKQSALEHVMWVLEQAGFGRDPRERMDKALEQLTLAGLTDPEVARLRPGDLNRTERKQVALARALALDPPLLLADEPTGGVHSASADHIFQILRNLTAKGNTVFMVTSDLLWARNADRQIEILDGTIVGSLS